MRIVEELMKIWPNKVYDTIDLKEKFKPQKERIYPLSKNKREKV